MELLSVSLKGFRRFKEPSTIQLNGKLVAVLGPNEAGKSSILKAVWYLGNDNPIIKGDISRDAEEDAVEIIGRFFLSKEDLEAASLQEPGWLVIEKKADGERTYDLMPESPTRDIRHRPILESALRKARVNRKFLALIGDNQEPLDAIDRIIGVISTDEETLTSVDIENVKRDAALLEGATKLAPVQYISNLPNNIAECMALEEVEEPLQLAVNCLAKRVPPILMFGEESRSLDSSYDLEEVSANPPLALANLANIAGLNLVKLNEARNDEDTAKIRTLEDQANGSLKSRFAETWSQSGVHVTLAVHNDALEVLVNNDGSEYTRLAERSDGLRQFVALQCFTTRERVNDPILLIDEAEQRLHYDAQADLTQMLAKQHVSSKIIYTTHSAGCLPEDLGNGVRLVTPDPNDSSASAVRNRFWDSNEVGFSPLLFGMGASTLAFFPTRRAAVVEGEADLLLLPTMLREAHSLEALGFQVVPGLSKSNKSALPSLFGASGGVAYFLDGDGGGKNLKGELLENGVQENRVFSLKIAGFASCELEDFIDRSLLVESINEIVAKFYTSDKMLSKMESRSCRTMSDLEILIKKKIGEKISKVNIAYQILSALQANPNRTVLDLRRAQAFKKCTGPLINFFSASTSKVTTA